MRHIRPFRALVGGFPGPKDGTNGKAFGVAVAGRVAVTDKTGLATRVEYVTMDDDFAGSSDSNDTKIVSLTGTVDHSLTDNLVVRGEVRWDHSLENDVAGFPATGGSATGVENDQVVLMAEIYYAF